MDQEVSSFKTRELVIKDLSRGVHSKGISMDRGSCQEAITQPEGISMDQAAIENAIKSN